MDGADAVREAEEIATLCVGKLRGMIVVDGDPNRSLKEKSLKESC